MNTSNDTDRPWLTLGRSVASRGSFVYLILSILIIGSLVVLFYFIDRRGFLRNDNAQSVWTESIADHVESPFASPSKQKSESFSAEKKEVAISTKVPAAVPVVSMEDAEVLNKQAIDYAVAEKEMREPFYRLYQNIPLKSVAFEGTVRATSVLPDPEKNDYDNCLYALFVEIDSLLTELPEDQTIACEIIVDVPILKDKKLIKDYIFLPGDKVRCSCAEYDSMPQEIQEIQLSDDIQSYEHEQYYAFGIKKISAFQTTGNRNFAKREITILPIQSLPKDDKASNERKKRIKDEIKRIEEELKKHGGTFAKWKEEYNNTIAEKYKQLCRDNYKGWINDSFCAAGGPLGNESTYNTKDYIDGILPYKLFLEENNIDLIVLRVPSRGDFAARILASDDVFQENPAWVEHYYECLKNDIEIVDPMPEMWKSKLDFPLFYFYHIPTESHPFEGFSFSAAKVLSDVLKRYSYPASDLPIELEDCVFETTQPRFYWPEGNPKFNPKELIHFKRVIRDGASIGPLVDNTGSPFVFLSNSFFAYPQRYSGASVPTYTAYFIQHIPDWFYQDGIGNPMLRNLIAVPQILSNRKAVIMVGHPFNWNGSFPPFPQYIADKAKIISLEKTLELLSSEIQIPDNGSFIFNPDKDGITHFSQNHESGKANNTFNIELSVPALEEKRMCMLRINFGTNSYITMNASDRENGSSIDSMELSPGTNLHADLFIPIRNVSRKISIQFKLAAPDRQYSIRNIELWYY